MRILCLHGYGTSSAILRSQLDAFIHRADATHEFAFLDGEFECPRGRGIGTFAQGPFRCFNTSFGPHAIQASLDRLQAFIEDEGPFDGILGFSQGGSLALACLLQMAGDMRAEGPGARPVFGFAVLVSTIVAFSPDPEFCGEIVTGLTERDREVLGMFPHDAGKNDYASLSGPPERAVFFRSLGRVLDTSLRGGFIAPGTPLGTEGLLSPDARDALEELPRIVHPALLPPELRIPIPTVHVVGAADDALLVGMSRLMEGLCAGPELTRSLVHDGGHDVPRKVGDVRALWAAVEWAAEEASRQVW
ncbi:hypothetical protein CSOJ01_12853 [Colletotrichum sojae]|uniref:Serine hydrolase domain-containing protein n=1 Tax=Colletotrichum sojae TaxID=2175907 RepID=A0A8H6IUI0_9PEZI|nr:hypothetical protein CSOJ01_12853 [Colletotrichum sojae]